MTVIAERRKHARIALEGTAILLAASTPVRARIALEGTAILLAASTRCVRGCHPR